jgi:hypothetical protein
MGMLVDKSTLLSLSHSALMSFSCVNCHLCYLLCRELNELIVSFSFFSSCSFLVSDSVDSKSDSGNKGFRLIGVGQLQSCQPLLV